MIKMKYYTSKDLLSMNLTQLQDLTSEQLIEGICTLEVTIYTLESQGYSYSKENAKQREIKSILLRRCNGIAMSY